MLCPGRLRLGQTGTAGHAHAGKAATGSSLSGQSVRPLVRIDRVVQAAQLRAARHRRCGERAQAGAGPHIARLVRDASASMPGSAASPSAAKRALAGKTRLRERGRRAQPGAQRRPFKPAQRAGRSAAPGTTRRRAARPAMSQPCSTCTGSACAAATRPPRPATRCVEAARWPAPGLHPGIKSRGNYCQNLARLLPAVCCTLASSRTSACCGAGPTPRRTELTVQIAAAAGSSSVPMARAAPAIARPGLAAAFGPQFTYPRNVQADIPAHRSSRRTLSAGRLASKVDTRPSSRSSPRAFRIPSTFHTVGH